MLSNFLMYSLVMVNLLCCEVFVHIFYLFLKNWAVYFKGFLESRYRFFVIGNCIICFISELVSVDCIFFFFLVWITFAFFLPCSVICCWILDILTHRSDSGCCCFPLKCDCSSSSRFGSTQLRLLPPLCRAAAESARSCQLPAAVHCWAPCSVL